MKKQKKIAFIFALPYRSHPILITMPFGLNIIKILDKKGYEIDIYLTEYTSESYKDIFSNNVKIHYLNHNYLWPKEGFLSFLFLTSYFKYISIFKLRNKYSTIYATGMGGITLGGILKRSNKRGKFVYLNDEFPEHVEPNIWSKSEINYGEKSDIVITPDEYRFAPLCKQVKNINNNPHYTLPNTPLISDVQDLPEINWHEYFNVDPSKKLFLMAGGLQGVNQIEELLRSVKSWPEEAVLIVKGKHDFKGFKEIIERLGIPNRIYWSVEQFSPQKLHSLIKYCTASICLYEKKNDNLIHIGKSSGKLMRSVLLGRPVIITHSESVKFVEDLGVGKLVEDENEIADAVKYILENEELLSQKCIENYPKISFETYWEVYENAELK